MNIPKRYKNKGVSELLKIAKDWVHKYVRLRDDKGGYFVCMSSGRHIPIHYNDKGDIADTNYQAGHYIHASECSGLRFEYNNIHGQCLQDNYFKHGNAIPYRQRLVKKIGVEAVEKLEFQKDWYKRNPKKWDRFELIEVILKAQEDYKSLKAKRKYSL